MNSFALSCGVPQDKQVAALRVLDHLTNEIPALVVFQKVFPPIWRKFEGADDTSINEPRLLFFQECPNHIHRPEIWIGEQILNGSR
jgi:hypothetical protein